MTKKEVDTFVKAGGEGWKMELSIDFEVAEPLEIMVTLIDILHKMTEPLRKGIHEQVH